MIMSETAVEEMTETFGANYDYGTFENWMRIYFRTGDVCYGIFLVVSILLGIRLFQKAETHAAHGSGMAILKLPIFFFFISFGCKCACYWF